MPISNHQIENFEARLTSIRRQLTPVKAGHGNQSFLDRLNRSRSWLDRALVAVRAHDYEETFIGLWIALNALYGVSNSEQRERERIREYVELLWGTDREALRSCMLDCNRHVKIRGFLHNRFLLRAYWNGNRSELNKFLVSERGPEKVLEAFHGGQANKVLEAILERLYVLRNQIFHGCSTDRRGTNQGSLLPSLRILMVLLPTFLTIMMQGDNPKKWGKLPYPRVTSPDHPKLGRV